MWAAAHDWRSQPSREGKRSEGRRRMAGWGRALLPPAALLVLAPLVLAPDPVSRRGRPGTARPRRGGAAGPARGLAGLLRARGRGRGGGAFVFAGVGSLGWQTAV